MRTVASTLLNARCGPQIEGPFVLRFLDHAPCFLWVLLRQVHHAIQPQNPAAPKIRRRRLRLETDLLPPVVRQRWGSGICFVDRRLCSSFPSSFCTADHRAVLRRRGKDHDPQLLQIRTVGGVVHVKRHPNQRPDFLRAESVGLCGLRGNETRYVSCSLGLSANSLESHRNSLTISPGSCGCPPLPRRAPRPPRVSSPEF